jgi:hypothetical protein
VEALGDALADAEADEADAGLPTNTGFKTCAVEAVDEMLLICMAISPLQLKVDLSQIVYRRTLLGLQGKFFSSR